MSLQSCRECGVAKAKSEFRLRRHDGESRLRQCRTCHNYTERLRRYGSRSREHSRLIAKHLTRLRSARAASRVTGICEEMVRGFGGTEGFTREWKNCLHQDLNRGGFAALRHFEAVVRLIQHGEETRPDYSQMTDDALEAELLATREQVQLAQHGGSAVAAATEAMDKIMSSG